MTDDDKLPHITPAADPLAHLTLRDTRTPEERREAESRELARRRGKGKKDWWKKHQPPES